MSTYKYEYKSGRQLSTYILKKNGSLSDNFDTYVTYLKTDSDWTYNYCIVF